jgi:small subunit ribosomal protein S2
MALDEFLSAGVHIGMKQRTKDMERFIYKVRPDGLAVLDVQAIQKRIEIAGKFLAKHKNIMAVSRKPIGQRAVKKFAEAIGAKHVIGRFLPGTLTNPSFRNYFEPDAIIISDPVIDSQAIREAIKVRIPIVAFCDTIDDTSNIDFVIPSNNKGKKSIALLYYLLAKEILKNRGAAEGEIKFKASDFESRERAMEE